MYKSMRIGIFFAIYAVIFSSCGTNTKHESSPPVSIPYLQPGLVSVTDHSLRDWDGVSPVLNLTGDQQWEKIRGRKAETLSGPNDMSVKVYLAWDGECMFFAVDVMDDKVLLASNQPWSGDCAELFFVGFDSQFKKDYHDLVENRSEGYKNVFQLVLSGGNLSPWASFPSWRTDAGISNALIKNEFSAAGWRTEQGWQAEAKIPLAALGNVLEVAKSGVVIKIGIDVLDYDQQIAPNTEKYKWGYYPDNVLSNSNSEKELNQPNRMGKFIFQM